MKNLTLYATPMRRNSTSVRKGLIAIVVFVAASVAVGLFVWWYTSLESREVRVPTDEASLNPWLAITMLFEAHNLSVKRVSPISDETSATTRDTIVVEHGPYTIETASKSAYLEKWVSAGGTLILRVTDVWDEEQSSSSARKRFPMSLGVYVNNEPVANASRYRFATFPPCPNFSHEVTFDNYPPLRMQGIEIDETVFNLDHVAEGFNPEILGAGLVRMNYGNGRIYFVKYLNQWTNGSVGCFDNAYILLSIVSNFEHLNPRLVGPTMWVMPIVAFPSIFELIWKNAPQAVIGIVLAFLILIFVWNIRLSPPAYELSGPRRSAYEYTTSAAKFAWRNKDLRAYLIALGTNALRDHPLNLRDQLISKTAKRLGTSETKLREALKQEQRAPNESELIEKVRLVQALYRKD